MLWPCYWLHAVVLPLCRRSLLSPGSEVALPSPCLEFSSPEHNSHGVHCVLGLTKPGDVQQSLPAKPLLLLASGTPELNSGRDNLKNKVNAIALPSLTTSPFFPLNATHSLMAAAHCARGQPAAPARTARGGASSVPTSVTKGAIHKESFQRGIVLPTVLLKLT